MHALKHAARVLQMVFGRQRADQLSFALKWNQQWLFQCHFHR
jgi:hypothetical protein